MTYESSFLFYNICSVQDPRIIPNRENERKNDDASSFIITVMKNDVLVKYYFKCESERQKNYWIHAISWSYYHYIMNAFHNEEKRKSISSSILKRANWYFQVIQTSLYSAAVRGDEYLLQNLLTLCGPDNLPLDELDPYNGYSALHYAIMLDNLNFARALISAGASVNNLCRNKSRSPLYYGMFLFLLM